MRWQTQRKHHFAPLLRSLNLIPPGFAGLAPKATKRCCSATSRTTLAATNESRSTRWGACSENLHYNPAATESSGTEDSEPLHDLNLTTQDSRSGIHL